MRLYAFDYRQENVARAVLRVLLEQPIAPFLRVAKLCRKLNDTESAKKAAERGVAQAGETYTRDADPDDTNQAIRFLWPSVQEWRDLIDVAIYLARFRGRIDRRSARRRRQVAIRQSKR